MTTAGIRVTKAVQARARVYSNYYGNNNEAMSCHNTHLLRFFLKFKICFLYLLSILVMNINILLLCHATPTRPCGYGFGGYGYG
jgi:hypothetical protein